MMTERVTSFSGLRHSSEKMAAPSKPLKADIAIFVNTFKVRIEAAGHAKDRETRVDGRPKAAALIRRNRSTRNVPTIRTAAALPHHFARCSPRTLNAYAVRHTRTVRPSAIGLLFSIQD